MWPTFSSRGRPRCACPKPAPGQKTDAEHASKWFGPKGFTCTTLSFDEQTDKKTVVTMRQLHPTKAQRDAGVGFGAVELGYQTLDKFAEYLRTQR